jgi:hypothetical protein
MDVAFVEVAFVVGIDVEVVAERDVELVATVELVGEVELVVVWEVLVTMVVVRGGVMLVQVVFPIIPVVRAQLVVEEVAFVATMLEVELAAAVDVELVADVLVAAMEDVVRFPVVPVELVTTPIMFEVVLAGRTEAHMVVEFVNNTELDVLVTALEVLVSRAELVVDGSEIGGKLDVEGVVVLLPDLSAMTPTAAIAMMITTTTTIAMVEIAKVFGFNGSFFNFEQAGQPLGEYI